jgi:hypothetical protein
MQPTDLESEVLHLSLAGDHPLLGILRQQLPHTTVAKREFTGVGFYSDLAVAATAPRIVGPQGKFEISDVFADVPGLQYGVGFVLFVREGIVSLLEGYTFDEAWPASLEGAVVRYIHGTRDLTSIFSAV